MPKIEVTFDIDANGIVNVSAKDQATGKEQKITITGSSGLSEAEVQRMVQEAEAHAEEDRQRREAIEPATTPRAMVFQAEKMLTEYGDRIPSEIKADSTPRSQTVKEILDNDRENVDRLRPAYEEMVQTLSKVGTAMYEAAGAQGGADGAPATSAPTARPSTPADDETTVEGEFREVGSDR